MTATDDDLRFMRLAIDEMKKCVDEPGRKSPAPMVGAVVVKDGAVLAATHRGCGDPGAHAEYIALEKEIAQDQSTAGAVLYTTLEPCTTRNHPKVPCAERVCERRFSRVFVGMVDPDPRITGKGIRRLQERGIEVLMFPKELVDEIEDLNRKFTRCVEAAPAAPATSASPAPAPAVVIQNVGGDVIVSTGQSGGITAKNVAPDSPKSGSTSNVKLVGVGVIVASLLAGAAAKQVLGGGTGDLDEGPRAASSAPASAPSDSLKARLSLDETRSCRLINDGDTMRNVELMHGSWVVNTKSREMMGGEPVQGTRMVAKAELGFADQLGATLPDFASFNLCRRLGIPEGCRTSEDCVALFSCAAQFQRADGRRWEMQQLLASPLSDDGSCELTQVHLDFLDDAKPFDRLVKEALGITDEKRGIHEFLRQGLQRSVGPRVREVSDKPVETPSLAPRKTAAPPPPSSPPPPVIAPSTEAPSMNDDKKQAAPLNISNVTGDVVVSQGQTGGITAHTVNVNAPTARGLTADQRAQVVAALAQGRGARIKVEIVGGDEPAEFARVLDSAFRAAEWNVGRITKVGNVSRRGVTARAREPLPSQVGVLVAALKLGGVDVGVLPDPRMDAGDVWLQVGAP